MYSVDEYIDVGEYIEFPEEINVAFAVCGVECGHNVLIVDGQTQICEFCGGTNFRTDVKLYKLIGGDKSGN